jgi:hypothetical protein
MILQTLHLLIFYCHVKWITTMERPADILSTHCTRTLVLWSLYGNRWGSPPHELKNQLKISGSYFLHTLNLLSFSCALRSLVRAWKLLFNVYCSLVWPLNIKSTAMHCMCALSHCYLKFLIKIGAVVVWVMDESGLSFEPKSIHYELCMLSLEVHG